MDRIDPSDATPTSSYPSPVDKLLTIGEPEIADAQEWPDYLKLGLNAEDIPALIRMALDEKLNQADSDSLEVWAPLHAMRTLGQLHALEAIKPLLTVFDRPQDDEWAIEELPQVFSRMGPAALPILEAYIADKSNNQDARVNAATGISRIAEDFPDLRTESLRILTTQLDNNTDDGEFSGFIISDLINLHAPETMSSIERAIKEDRVDLSIAGNLDDVREGMGLLSPEEFEKRQADRLARLSSLSSIISPRDRGATPSSSYYNSANPARRTSSKKAKNKMAKQSRKKNRKR